MGTNMFIITDKFKNAPTFSADGKTITFGALEGSDTNAKKMANKTINVDAYYSQYDKANDWWTYVSTDKTLILALKSGATVKDMGTNMFIITNKFKNAPTFSADGKTITFGALKGGSCANVPNDTIDSPDVNSSIKPPMPPMDKLQ